MQSIARSADSIDDHYSTIRTDKIIIIMYIQDNYYVLGMCHRIVPIHATYYVPKMCQKCAGNGLMKFKI